MDRLDLELKSLNAPDEAGNIEGLAWPFGSPDRVGDVIEKGAFTGASLPLPMLFGHDPNDPVGAWTEAHEGPDGLRLKGKLLVDDVARAREVHAMVKAGAVRGLSIGFITKKSTPRPRGGRTISALDLFECSLVSTPMHSGAHVSSIKGQSMDPEDIQPEATPLDIAAIETKAADTVMASIAPRLDKIEARLSRPAIIGNADERTIEQKAFNTFLRRGEAMVPEVERKALTVASDASAGYLVAPDPLIQEILKTVTEFSPMRQLAHVTGISSGGALIPRRTTQPAAVWVGEIADRTETTAAYEQVQVNVHEAATFVDVSQHLLEDAAFNIEGELTAELGLAFAKLEAAAFVSGNGTGKPTGFMNGTTIGEVNSGTAATITADSLIDLYHSIPTAYVGQAVWAMNRKTMAIIRKMKATDGTYLWQESIAAGNPPTILGRPVIEFADMPDVAANARPIAFADFGTSYRIFDRVGLTLMRDPYSRATNGIIRFHARRRVGGLVVMPEAAKLLKVAA